MGNLNQASKQWASRPADERYWTIDELLEARRKLASQSGEKHGVEWSSLRASAQDDDIQLVGTQGNPAHLTNWSFGQLAAGVAAPAGYLQRLPAELAANCLNHGLAVCEKEPASLLFNTNGSLTIRALNSDRYTRIWDSQILERLVSILPNGWRLPPARPAGKAGERTRIATQEDCLRLQVAGLSIQPGDIIAPAGAYASDRDMFVFLVNENTTIDAGEGSNLGRGFFLWNSEVGAKTFGIMSFLYDAVCGNHIVWNAKDVKEIRFRHVGNADERAFVSLRVDLVEYVNSAAGEIESRIKAARSYTLGATKEEALDALLGIVTSKRLQLTQGQCDDAYNIAASSTRYGSPRSVWGIVNGLTELSQQTEYADKRVSIDRAAGKLLEVAF